MPKKPYLRAWRWLPGFNHWAKKYIALFPVHRPGENFFECHPAAKKNKKRFIFPCNMREICVYMKCLVAYRSFIFWSDLRRNISIQASQPYIVTQKMTNFRRYLSLYIFVTLKLSFFWTYSKIIPNPSILPQAGVYTDAQLKFRHLVCTIVVFGTLLVFVTCFVHIFAVVRRANADVVGFQSGSLPPYVSRNFNGNVSRIAISQVKGTLKRENNFWKI